MKKKQPFTQPVKILTSLKIYDNGPAGMNHVPFTSIYEHVDGFYFVITAVKIQNDHEYVQAYHSCDTAFTRRPTPDLLNPVFHIAI